MHQGRDTSSSSDGIGPYGYRFITGRLVMPRLAPDYGCAIGLVIEKCGFFSIYGDWRTVEELFTEWSLCQRD